MVVAFGLLLPGCNSRLTAEDMMVDIKQETIFNISRKTDPSSNITTISSTQETTDIYYNGYGEKTGERPSTLVDVPILEGFVKIHPDGRREYFIVHSIKTEGGSMSSYYQSTCMSDDTISFSLDGAVAGPIPGEFYKIDSGRYWYGFVRINVDSDTFRKIAVADSLVARSCLDNQDILSGAEINALRNVFNESLK